MALPAAGLQGGFQRDPPQAATRRDFAVEHPADAGEQGAEFVDHKHNERDQRGRQRQRVGFESGFEDGKPRNQKHKGNDQNVEHALGDDARQRAAAPQGKETLEDGHCGQLAQARRQDEHQQHVPRVCLGRAA